MSNVPLHFNHVEEVSPSLIQLTMDESQANYLLASLTAEEREGIQYTVNSDGLTVLTLPPRFHWVPVEQAAPSLFRRLHLETVPNGGPRIQLVYNLDGGIQEVNILNP